MKKERILIFASVLAVAFGGCAISDKKADSRKQQEEQEAEAIKARKNLLESWAAAEAESKAGKTGLTDEQLKIYSTIGGTPHLDGQYTVFGEVEEGLDIVEMIQNTATGRGDRPVDDIEMKVTVIE